MFQTLTTRLGDIFSKIGNKPRLNDTDISDALREVRIALLEADVSLPAAKAFIERVKGKATEQTLMVGLSPKETLIKLVKTELTSFMGKENQSLNLQCAPPAVILMAGLQGSGKTTTAAKLAKRLQEVDKKKVMLVSADIYRPAAIEQLRVLSEQIGAMHCQSSASDKPVSIVKDALSLAKKQFADVLIIDTAGRLHVDTEMMDEIKLIHKHATPIETLFVVDSMTGQDATHAAAAFHDALPLTGVILTKTDGDTRGGAALSIREITGKPIKFLGIGEKVDALEPFHPERIASRLLGMGDMLSLIEEMERKVDEKKAKKLAQKIQKRSQFDLEDFRDQMLQMQNLGGFSEILDKLPGMGGLKQMAQSKLDNSHITQTIAIINSMTIKERRFPALLRSDRKKRIANGSGVQIVDVNRVLKQFEKMQKMAKRFGSKKNMSRLMSQMGGGNGGFGDLPMDELQDMMGKL